MLSIVNVSDLYDKQQKMAKTKNPSRQQACNLSASNIPITYKLACHLKPSQSGYFRTNKISVVAEIRLVFTMSLPCKKRWIRVSQSLPLSGYSRKACSLLSIWLRCVQRPSVINSFIILDSLCLESPSYTMRCIQDRHTSEAFPDFLRELRVYV
ncbi:hypothetical protein BY458DRAFT_491658 [Sporodiniella umbellata]|nr:hypothetical protein BY458DRAFT_491658 [Sporodiniella umbellata]